MVLCHGGHTGTTRELILQFNVEFGVKGFSFNFSGHEVNVFKSFGDVVCIKTKSGDRVSEQFSSILNECRLFSSNEVKYSLNSFNVSGFVGNFIGPFDGITNKCGTSFDDVHNFIGSLSSGLDSSDDGHWVSEILELELSSI